MGNSFILAFSVAFYTDFTSDKHVVNDNGASVFKIDDRRDINEGMSSTIPLNHARLDTITPRFSVSLVSNSFVAKKEDQLFWHDQVFTVK